MRVVVVVAHPDPSSFTHAIASTATTSLKTRRPPGDGARPVRGGVLRTGDADLTDEHLASQRAKPIPRPDGQAACRESSGRGTRLHLPDLVERGPGDPQGLARAGPRAGVGFVFDEHQRVRRGSPRAQDRRNLHIGSPGSTCGLSRQRQANPAPRLAKLNTATFTRRSWIALYEMDTRTRSSVPRSSSASIAGWNRCERIRRLLPSRSGSFTRPFATGSLPG